MCARHHDSQFIFRCIEIKGVLLAISAHPLTLTGLQVRLPPSPGRQPHRCSSLAAPAPPSFHPAKELPLSSSFDFKPWNYILQQFYRQHNKFENAWKQYEMHKSRPSLIKHLRISYLLREKQCIKG